MDQDESRIEAASYHEAVELFFREGLSDGLPVVPPALVREMVRRSGRRPDEEIGEVPPRMGVATIEKLAVNAVMAGCLPEYFPVVLAAVEALLDPAYDLRGALASTHANEPLIIVHGPVARELGINSGERVFGSGYRANGTIGRAVRLILSNVGGNHPRNPDKKTFSHPGSWSYCIAEAEEASPWPPFHADRGLPADASAVTVFACEVPHSIIAGGAPAEVLHAICNAMATVDGNNIWFMGQTLLVLSPLIAQGLHREGWSKADVQRHMWEHARVPVGTIRHGGPHTAPEAREAYAKGFWLGPKWLDQQDDREMVPLVKRPEDILVIVAGGQYIYSAFCPGWGDFGGFAVTREIQRRRSRLHAESS